MAVSFGERRNGCKKMQERRQHHRITLSVDVNLSSNDNFYAGAARDISLGGLFVETDISLPIGCEVTVQLRLVSKVLSVQAEVVWVVTEGARTVGMGLSFVRLPSGPKREIEDFMKQRQPMRFSVDAEAPPPVPPLPGPARPRK